MRALPSILCAAIALTCAPVAWAETPAEALYREGVEAYAAGDLATACPKFERSFATDRQPAPLFMWAKCAQKEGRLASALDHFEEVLRLGGLEAALRDEAAKAVTDLGPRVPRLAIAPSPTVPDAVARIDGVVTPIGGKPIALDPGPHVLRVEHPRHAPKETTLTLEEGKTLDVTVELGAALPEAPPPGAAPASSGGGDGLFVAALVAGGVGVAGFATAGVTGALVLDACGGSLGCAARTDDEPGTGLLVANGIGWGLGVAGAATSVVLFVLSAGASDAAPTEAGLYVAPAPGPLGVGLGYRF